MDNPAELLPLYQEYGATIREAKRGQWASVYYALLVLAGLIGYSDIIGASLHSTVAGCVTRAVLCLAYILVALFVTWYIWSAHYSIVRYRQRLQAVRGKLSESFQEIVHTPEPSRDHFFPFFFSTVVASGSGFLFWLMFPSEVQWLVIVLIVVALLAVTSAFLARGRQEAITRQKGNAAAQTPQS